MTSLRTRSLPLILLSALLLVSHAGCANPGSAQAPEPDQTEAPSVDASEEVEPAEEDALDVDPDSPPDGFETMTVFRVVPTGEGAAVLLVDEQERMVVPIFVGDTIAMSIQLRLNRRRYARPLTHDLLAEMVEKLGGEPLKVHIDDVKGGIFVGTVFLRDAGGEVLTFDSRSSDAIAFALGHDIPIFVSGDVVDKAGVDTDQFEDDSMPKEQLPEQPETQPL